MVTDIRGQGDQILLESKIISVADVVEAILSHCPYRKALGIDAASMKDNVLAKNDYLVLSAQLARHFEVYLNVSRCQTI